MRAFVIAVIAALWGGCASTPPPSEYPLARDYEHVARPSWVDRPCAGGIWRAHRVVCSVGTASGIKDPSLAIATAEAHGRASIAASVKAQLKTKWNEAATHSSDVAGEEDVESIGQNRDSEEAVQMALSGVRPEATWASQSGIVYVLMVLDVARFDASVAKTEATPLPNTNRLPAKQADRAPASKQATSDR